MLEPSCCSIVKFHSLTVGVFAFASIPCGAKVLHGVGTLGPQARGGCTPLVMGRKFESAPVNVTDPLYGGQEVSKNDRMSINWEYMPKPARTASLPFSNGFH